MLSRAAFAALLPTPVIGMVHLAPLPGSSEYGGDLDEVLRAALRDAAALREGGVGAVLVENFHDAPFHPGRVPPVTVACLAVVVRTLRTAHPELPVGVNVLRNDAEAALAVAAATGAAFVRVNVHAGAAVTDQGLIGGRAHRTLRLRRDLGLAPGDAAGGVAILADLRVKHARPLAERPLAEEAQDLRRRGRADVIIVTGVATGAGVAAGDLMETRRAVPDAPLLAGSGVTTATAFELAALADGCIVGTALKAEGDMQAPVSVARTRDLVSAWVAGRQAAREPGSVNATGGTKR
ncbi:MAG: BtpA/SgcQ family protein [Candidatus Krumholzibacteriia bacterium]